VKKFLARFKIPETGCSRMLNYEVSTIVKKCQSSHSQNCAHQQLWFFSNAFTALYFQKEEEDPTCLLLEDFLIDATHVLHNILPGGLIYSFVSKQSTAICITLSHIAWQGTSAKFLQLWCSYRMQSEKRFKVHENDDLIQQLHLTTGADMVGGFDL